MASLCAAWAPYTLNFNFEARTSRETLTTKPTWFIKVWDTAQPDVYGLGECALFPGLSAEPMQGYENMLSRVCRAINHGNQPNLANYSSIRMGLETAMLDLDNGGCRNIFPNRNQDSAVINGLIWMGSKQQMIARIEQKLAQGFRCLKLKIGGINFDDEVKLLQAIRQAFSPDELELRLDANGAFHPEQTLDQLKCLSAFSIHSIEQPIRQGQYDQMSHICSQSPIPIALDEELIGITDSAEMLSMLRCIRPRYIILKPSLCGGFSGCQQWIQAAQKVGVGWWLTSALESNIGLNAIAQFAMNNNVGITPQGLGTGQIYSNNITSPLRLTGQRLSINPDGRWEIPSLQWITPE